MKPGGKRSLASRVTISDPSDYQEIEREVEAKAPRAQTWAAGEKAAVEQGPPSGAFGLLFDAIDASSLGASRAGSMGSRDQAAGDSGRGASSVCRRSGGRHGRR